MLIDNAKLSNADLRNATLRNVDLRNTKCIAQSQLQDAYLCETQLPDNITLDPNQGCKQLKEWGR